jgi:hypothetical protein
MNGASPVGALPSRPLFAQEEEEEEGARMARIRF